MAQRWGLTLPLPGTPLADHEEHVKRAEAAGYTDLWSGETNGPDGFTPLALSAAWTERARLGTGIVGVFQRGPALLAQEAAALADASGGRFVLGIGSSSDRIVEGWNGIPFERPLSKVRETAGVPAGRARRRAHRERLQAGDGAGPAGADRARGAARQDARPGGGARRRRLHQLPAARRPAQGDRAAGGRPEGFELLCRFFCLPGEREAVEPLARFMFSSYITVPVYAAFYRWLGYGEQIDAMVAAWEAGDRQAAAAAAPWELIEDMFIFGTPEQMRERLDAFVAGGVTLPILTPIVPPDALGETIEALAP